MVHLFSTLGGRKIQTEQDLSGREKYFLITLGKWFYGGKKKPKTLIYR